MKNQKENKLIINQIQGANNIVISLIFSIINPANTNNIVD